MTFSLPLKKLGAMAVFGLLGGFAFVANTASAATFFVPNELPNARVGVRYTQEVRSNHPGIPYTWTRTGALQVA